MEHIELGPIHFQPTDIITGPSVHYFNLHDVQYRLHRLRRELIHHKYKPRSIYVLSGSTVVRKGVSNRLHSTALSDVDRFGLGQRAVRGSLGHSRISAAHELSKYLPNSRFVFLTTSTQEDGNVSERPDCEVMTEEFSRLQRSDPGRTNHRLRVDKFSQPLNTISELLVIVADAITRKEGRIAIVTILPQELRANVMLSSILNIQDNTSDEKRIAVAMDNILQRYRHRQEDIEYFARCLRIIKDPKNHARLKALQVIFVPSESMLLSRAKRDNRPHYTQLLTRILNHNGYKKVTELDTKGRRDWINGEYLDKIPET